MMAADLDDTGSMTLQRRQAIRRRGYNWGSREQGAPFVLEDGDGMTTGKRDRNRPKTIPVSASCPSRSSVDLTPTLLSMYDKFASSNNGSDDNSHKGSNGVDDRLANFNHVTSQQQSTSVKLLAKEENRCSSDRSITAMEGVNVDLTDSSKPCNGTGGQKRPLSISSTSSSSSSSLPTNYRYKRPNLGNYEAATKSGLSNKLTLLELADSTSISNTSTDSLSVSESWSEEHSPERDSHNNDDDDSLYEHIEIPSSGPGSIPLVKVYSPQNSTSSSASLGEDDTLTSSPSHDANSRHKHSAKSGGDNSFGATSPSSPHSPKIVVHHSSNIQGSCLNGSSSESLISPIFGPVSPLQLPALTKDNRYVSYAQRVASEIVETEKLYVNSLKDIIEGYMFHINNCHNHNISKKDIRCLFGNLEEIYTFSQELLRELEECGEDPMEVARCFVDKNERFEIYTNYCTNYPDSMEVLTKFMLQPLLAERFKHWQAALGHGLPLGAYLLKPVQRILKYHLLLQNIVKNSEKDRPGYDTLAKALDHMTEMARHINEMKRRHEHAVRVQEVQSQLEDYEGPDLTTLGELVLEGSFRMIRVKGLRSVFLFEKGILITKRKEEGMFSCKASILCSNLMLVESISKEPLNFHVIPFDNAKMQYTLQARNIEMKRKWCQEIKRLIIDSYHGKIPDKVKSLVMGLGKGRDEDEELRNMGFRLTADDYDKKPRRKSGTTLIDLVKLKKSHRKNETTPPRLALISGHNQDSIAVTSSGGRLGVKQINQSMSGSRSMDNISLVGSTRRRSTGTPSSHANNNDQIQSHSKLNMDDATQDTSQSAQVENRQLEQAKLDAVNVKRAQSFKKATRFNTVLSLELSDTEMDNLSSPESMDTSDDDDGETVKPYSEDDVYIDLVYNNGDEVTSGYDGYSNLMYDGRGASMPVLNDEDHVTVNLRPEDGVPVSSDSHLRTLSLTRDDCSKSAECLTTNPTKNQFSNLIYQNVDFHKDSRCSSTNSSYDNLNKRWSNGSSHKADDEEDKPMASHQQTRAVQRVKRSSSASCSTSSTNLPKEKKPCDSGGKVAKADVQQKCSPATAVADGQQKSESAVKKQLCPVAKSLSFPLSSDVSKKISKENYDWFVYTNRVGSSLSGQFEKLLVYDKYGTRPRGLMAPSKFPAYVSSLEDKYDIQQKKTIVRYGTPPRTAMSSENMNSFAPVKGNSVADKLPVKGVPQIPTKPMKSRCLSTPRAWETSSAKEKFKFPGNKRPTSLTVGVIEDSKKIVEEMEKYVEKNDSLRGSSSSLGKFPSAAMLVSQRRGDADTFNHKLIHDQQIDRSRESLSNLSNKSRDSLSSGGGGANFMSLSRESLASSTGSSTKGKSSVGSSVVSNLNQSGAPTDGFVGSLRSKLNNLTSRLATRKPTPKVNSSNSMTKPGRNLSGGHFTSTFNARYKTRDQAQHRPESMVSHLAKIYSVCEKENTPSLPVSRKSDSVSPEKNTDYVAILRNRQLGSSALGCRIASSTSLHVDATCKAQSVPRQSPVPSSYTHSDTETCSDTMSVKSTDLNVDKETSPESPYRKCSEFSSNNIQLCDSAVSIPSGCDLPKTTSERQQYYSERRSSCNSNISGTSTDSIYERRLSQALDEPDDSVFRDSAVYSDMDTCSNAAMPQNGQQKQKSPRKSIREVVQQLEEKAKPKQVEVYGVRRREPGRSIQEKLRSLQESSQYHNRHSQTFDDDGIPVPRALRDMQQSLSVSRSSIEREESPGYTMRYKYGFPGQDIGMKSARSTSRLDQIDNINSLINMRGWVRQLINKFQADQ